MPVYFIGLVAAGMLFIIILSLILRAIHEYKNNSEKNQRDSLDALTNIEIQNHQIEYLSSEVKKIIQKDAEKEKRKNPEKIKDENKLNLEKLSKLL